MNRNILKINPFNDFWVDCYSTAIYSILLSCIPVDKAIIYNNNYQYKIVEVEKGSYSIMPKMDMDAFNNYMLKNTFFYDFAKDKNVIETIKKLFDENKLIFLGVDMYHWISETAHWHRNHEEHYSVISGYDDNKKYIKTLETGIYGYQEFMVSYEDVVLATRAYSKESEICEVDMDWRPEIYTIKSLRKNACRIIDSITVCLDTIAKVWNNPSSYTLDIIQTHLFSCENRNKVNKLLFQISFIDDAAIEYANEFEKLENAYISFKSLIIKKSYANRFEQDKEKLKDKFHDLLEYEKEIWVKFVNDDRLILKF